MIVLYSILAWVVSIYSFTIQTLGGNEISLSTYANKKIMLVNVASGSKYVNQLAELETLYQQHKDSLVIIVFPSDSFGKEPLSDSALHELFYDSLNVHYAVAVKSNVAGNAVNPVFKWLSDPVLNGGERSGEISADFQKVLIDRNGKIYAHFQSRVNPLHAIIQQAIAQP